MNTTLTYLESRPRKLLFAVMLLLVCAAGIIDVLTGVELDFSALYLLPVAMGAWFFGRGTGVSISIVSAIVWYVADFVSSNSYSHPVIPYWNALVMLGFFLATALALSTLRQAADRERKLAREIQEQLLPKETPRIAGFEISGAWEPAESVGGDYYDVIRLDDDAVVLCIGDVAGHGIPAALLMSNLQAAVRMLANSKLPPQDICARLNGFIYSNTPRDKFITFFYSVLNVRTKELVYANAGHNRPIILRGNGERVSLSEGGLALGLMQNSCYPEGNVCLEEGDLLLIYTDGAVEARNPKGEVFGEHRLVDTVTEYHKRGAVATCNGILGAVSQFCKGTYQDDLAMIALSVHATDAGRGATGVPVSYQPARI